MDSSSFSAREDESLSYAGERCSNWSLEEDMTLCSHVIEHGGLDEKHLGVPWFRENFCPMPAELESRTINSLALRFRYLHQELLDNIDSGNWAWLEEKHSRIEPTFFYTYEDDLALCQVIVEKGMVGKRIGQKWFRENVVGRVSALVGRSAAGLYGRYYKRLAGKLSRACGSQGNYNYSWLREMHALSSLSYLRFESNNTALQCDLNDDNEDYIIEVTVKLDGSDSEAESCMQPKSKKRISLL